MNTGTDAPNLDDAIREGLSRKEARRLALRTAEAIAAMHARGEVHGDLTPRSILLARAGGVSIVAAGAPQPALYRMRYVSPEAARREAPGPGADVFALSLIIRELIEGIPARRGTGDELAMEAIDGRVSVPHGLEGELVSLAALAASPHPENRPKASAFAAALKGQSQFKGFSRQDWLIIGAAVAAIVMLAIMLRESTRERARSTQQFEDARAAFEGFLGGIYPELDRVEVIAPLAEAGKRALASMETMLEEERGPRDRLLLARTLLWNGEAERVQGNDAEAKALFERAVERAEALDDPNEAAVILLAAETALGDLAVGRREFVPAARHYSSAIAVGQTQLKERPGSKETRIAFARALMGYGELRMSSGPSSAEQARGYFARARGVLADESLNGEVVDRDALEIQVRLNRLEANIAVLEGNPVLAIQKLRQHVAGAEQLVEMDPGRPHLRQALAQGASVLGNLERTTGRLTDAAESQRKAVEGWRLLRAMEPSEIRWRRQWARSTRDLASLLADIGEWQEAALLHDTSLADMSMLLDTGQLPATADLELGEQLLDSAEGLHAAGDLQAARQRIQEARGRIGPVVSSVRSENLWRRLKARADVIGAELALSEGNFQAAETLALKFLKEVEALSAEGRERSVRLERARALLVTSAVRAMKGEAEIAKSARERALGIADELIREDPGFVPAYVLQARTLFFLGEDAMAAEVLAKLEDMGYRGLDLGSVRAATAALRD
ncbi:Protein kinase domain protein [Planctomycetes bacterium Poly30]|uniref:Protein kinase domain protein n=1 Tax=Saltatorellus ferox TaxID=2528018 RepID=A0A518EMF9_9BACT|nr:Protein kinase domain protein [Planctomycetes bacterium Poly30]